VFAAIVAIMLFKAMPGVVFEAQRQREQLLIDRGNEYKHAIKLFQRRNGSFPTSLDQLDNFNNQRYIRHRFSDPMTGKKDWRLVHVMGPGFVLTDSKVTPPPMQNGQSGSGFGSPSNQSGFGQPGNTSGFGQSGTGQQSGFGQSGTGQQSGFGQSGNTSGLSQSGAAGQQSGFGQSSFGQSGNTSGFGQSGSSPSGFGNSSQSSFGQSGFGQTNTPAGTSGDAAPVGPDGKPLPTAAEIYGAKRRPAPTADAYMGPQQNAGNGQDTGLDQPLPLPGEPNSSQTGQNSPQNPSQNQGSAAQANNGTSPGGPNGANGGANGQPASPALDAVNSALRQQGQMPTRSSTFAPSGFGTISAGSIAGVASTAQGSSIKKVDKQTDYSKWEFVYNPQKEAAAGIAQGMQAIQGQGMQGPNGSNQNGQPGMAQSPNSSTPSGSGFGSPSGFGNSSSGFGSSSGGSSGSSFGNSSGSTNSSGNSSGFGNSGSSSTQQDPN
jgi:hypothetical protein